MSSPVSLGRYMSAGRTRSGWTITTKRGDVLGRVEWFDRWAQYEFLPTPGSGYSAGCCRDLAAFLDRETKARKAGGGVPGV